MSCEGCEDIITNAVSEVTGVDSVTADRHDSTVVVEGDADVAALIEAIDFAGYDAEVSSPESDSDEESESTDTDAETASESTDEESVTDEESDESADE